MFLIFPEKEGNATVSVTVSTVREGGFCCSQMGGMFSP